MILLDTAFEFLDTETLLKRIAVSTGIVIVFAALGGAVWYNLNLKDEFVEGKTETNYLRQETSRLGAETDSLKTDVYTKTKELKNGITITKDQTQKVESEVAQTKLFTREVQQEHNKFRNEAKIEITKLQETNQNLNDQIRIKEQEIKTELGRIQTDYEKLRKDVKLENEKLRESIASLNDQVRSKDAEITDLRAKLTKEIEYRNKYFFNR